MKKYLSILLVIISVVLFSCGQGSKEEQSDCTTPQCEQQQMYDEVIAVHDEVMPKLSQISELKAAIEARMDAEDDSLAKSNWFELMQTLDEADESMWVWMRQFNPEMDSTAIEANMIYLGEQQKEVDEVALKINSSIEKAEQALKD